MFLCRKQLLLIKLFIVGRIVGIVIIAGGHGHVGVVWRLVVVTKIVVVEVIDNFQTTLRQLRRHMYSCSGSFPKKHPCAEKKTGRFFFLFSSKKFLFLFREDCWKNEKKDHLRSTSSHQRSRLKNNTPSFPPLFSVFLDDDKYLCWKQRTFRGALSRHPKRSSFGG